MYKFKRNNHIKGSCCPLGTMHDNIVECYWFGVVTLKDCAKCSVRNDNVRISKGKE